MSKNIRTTEVRAIVNIDEEEVGFTRLRISQRMGEHHDFEVLVDYKTFDGAFHESPEVFMRKTNTRVIIDLFHADRPGKAYVFAGLTTNIRMIAEDGMHGGILFTGKSYTIELERGEMMQTYSNTNLKEIFKIITCGAMNLSVENTPGWKSDIDFAIQYRETDWQFLQRLCHQYRERFYYTGTELAIGPHPEFPLINLTYDVELRSFEICSRLQPNRYSTYYYSREENKNWEQDSPETVENAPNLLNIVSGRSDNLNLLRKPNVPVSAYVPDMSSLIEQTKRRKVSDGARMLYVKGDCKTCDVRIGRPVEVRMPGNMGGGSLGVYRVYEIVHELDQSGRYKCEFEALPCDLEYLPPPRVSVPAPYPIEVKVWDNVDPSGMGRVKVDFPFDERVCETWVPVMTFDAGGGPRPQGVVAKNRGAVIVSEIGDSCILGFLDGQDLAHPFIMGSIFHGDNTEKQGGGAGDHIKTFTDKAGSFYRFDTKKGSITIQDKKGSESQIFLDGEQNINVKAGKSVDVNVGDGACVLHMQHDGVTTLTAAKKIELTVGSSVYTMLENDVKLTTSESVDISSSKNHIGGETTMNDGNVYIN
jgi:uncharacterized protein involved in type VI secretion and phage assembly